MLQAQEYNAPEIGTLQDRPGERSGPEYIFARSGASEGREHKLVAEEVVSLANKVFGFNSWSSAIRDVQIDFVDENQSTRQIALGLSIVARVTLKDGTFHDEIGYGHVENCNGRAVAFEKSKRVAAADALTRALRQFGKVFGKFSHNSEYPSEVAKVQVAPSRWGMKNLHRHRNCALMREEVTADAPSEERSQPTMFARSHSNASDGTELEDEFGSNLFEEVDLSEGHPDEVVLGAATVTKVPADVSEMRSNNRAPH